MMVVEETNETISSLMSGSVSFLFYTATYIIYKRKKQEQMLKQIQNRH